MGSDSCYDCWEFIIEYLSLLFFEIFRLLIIFLKFCITGVLVCIWLGLFHANHQIWYEIMIENPIDQLPKYINNPQPPPKGLTPPPLPTTFSTQQGHQPMTTPIS